MVDIYGVILEDRGVWKVYGTVYPLGAMPVEPYEPILYTVDRLPDELKLEGLNVVLRGNLRGATFALVKFKNSEGEWLEPLTTTSDRNQPPVDASVLVIAAAALILLALKP